MTLPVDARPRLLRSAAALLAQLFFIAAGVYLGMQADDWKAERERREATRATLGNFRAELAENRALVAKRLPYHARLRDSLRAAFRSPPTSIPALFGRVQWSGLRPVTPAHTAWDLALATQALSYVEPPLAFAVADVYRRQAGLAEQNASFAVGAFTPSTFAQESPLPFMIALQAYLEDV